MLHLHQQFFELQCFIAYESKTYLQCFIVLHWKLFCRVDTTMLEFQSKYFPCIKQASRFAMFHCTWIEPCLAGIACTHSSLSYCIRLPHFMCCSVCRTMFDSAYTYNDKNLKLTSLVSRPKIWIWKCGFLAKMNAIGIQNPKLIVTNDYQHFLAHFEWFLSEVKWFVHYIRGILGQ